MNVSCSRTELRDALRVVGGVVDPRNIKPILKDIHLRTVNNMLEFSATDLEVGIKYFVRDVEVKTPGGIVVPVDPLIGIVNESPDERLSLEVNGWPWSCREREAASRSWACRRRNFPPFPTFRRGRARGGGRGPQGDDRENHLRRLRRETTLRPQWRPSRHEGEGRKSRDGRHGWPSPCRDPQEGQDRLLCRVRDHLREDAPGTAQDDRRRGHREDRRPRAAGTHPQRARRTGGAACRGPFPAVQGSHPG